MADIKEITVNDVVEYEDLAISVGSGDLEVYSTPMVVALMENASAQLASNYIDDDCTTVGIKINIDHTSATPLNAKVKATATLEENTGRKFTFTVVAYDEAGEIARGTHERVSVKKEKFQDKANNKFKQ